MAINYGIPSEQSMLDLGQVYMRAIELAWRDEEFKERLLKDPVDALSHYFHYNLPWNVELKVELPKGDGPSEDQNWGWDSNLQKWTLPRNKMSIGIPTPPKNIEDQAVALAMYHVAGPNYLFTCC